jgi:steroid 5-alpha reductase family enzyme
MQALAAIPIVLLLAVLVALAGSQGGATISGVPVYAVCVALAFVIQWIAFIGAYAMQTEKFYDLTGGITYISVTILALLVSPVRDGRAILLACLVAIWAVRLSSFLFLRIRKAGTDARFDDIKPSFGKFLRAWTIQGLWVSLTLAAALAAITTATRKDLGWVAWLGLAIWVLGFAIEVTADLQKTRFRRIPENRGKFISTGLWSRSRHPNYFGEIVLWVGVTVIAAPVLRGWQWVTLISPVFVALLLTRVSGVPILERRADAKWGGQEDYQAYKKRTPVLIPRL